MTGMINLETISIGGDDIIIRIPRYSRIAARDWKFCIYRSNQLLKVRIGMVLNE
jgi:hypothetical protein